MVIVGPRAGARRPKTAAPSPPGGKRARAEQGRTEREPGRRYSGPSSDMGYTVAITDGGNKLLRMRGNTRRLMAAVAAMAIIVAACSSSSKSSSSGGQTSSSTSAGQTNSSPSGGHETVTVGVITDVTGPAASGNKSSVQGVRAGVVWAGEHGYTVKYVVADTASSPGGALAAAQKLVLQDHVLAVLADSALTFAAAPYLTSHGVPVVGVDEDANEWQTALNMFSVYGAIHTNEVSTTQGLFLKNEGVTNLGALGYSISPSSAEAAKGAAVAGRRRA
jgi:branched-chain amino acid transport system substrate-binding protein